ncbi:CD276 antigen-like isoform X2 [Anguilla anguilla]|uniref:CD276 antigen-like isoform X2 n=1 Tax=Anguilla anguilla TaxID=7936 RepID=UPI0015A9293F|nr:CD276 antigen-like isoform X2 [Anguilla anguilla]
MSWNLRRTVISFLCLFFELHSFCNGEFEIKVPSAPLVVIHGHSTVLSCTFPVNGAFDLGSSVITWQRHLEVVHSFYHSRDQLDLQSRRYANRTSLYHSELERGNASLRLDRTTPEDAGEYTCAISTLTGSQKKSFPVKIAAFYTEPHLQVSTSPQSVELKLTSRGYPAPKVRWLDATGAELSNGTQTQLLTDTQGLYVVSSSLTQERGANSTLTFLLWNKDLHQEIRREFSLLAAAIVLRDESRSALYALLSVAILTVLGILGIILFLKKSRCFRGPDSTATREENTSLKTTPQSSEQEWKPKNGATVLY